jgi:ABC-2 type transport system permease protein
MRRALAVAKKEWRFRVRGNLWFLVLVQPILFCLVWGFCASLDLRDVRLSVLDQSESSQSRSLVRQFDASGAFQVVQRARSLGQVERALESGEASMALLIPARFAVDERRGRPAVQLVSDGTDPNIATLGVSYGVAVAREALAVERLPRPALRAWYNPSLRSPDLLLLGAICYNLFWLLMYPAHSLMDERERGTMNGLGATPLSAAELWLGVQLAIGAVGLLGTLMQVGLIVGLAGVPLRGDLWLLFGGMFLFAFVHINLGCAMPLIARNGGQRTLYGLVGVFLAMSVAGFLIPQPFLPGWTRPLAELVPLKHGLLFIRAVFLKGAGLASVARELTALTMAAAVTSVVALFSLHRLLRGAA